MKKENGNPYNILSVQNAFEVLEYIVKRQTDVNAVEIHSHLGIPKPTLHKLLQTLKEIGYIDQNPDTQQYYATYRMLQMSYYSLDRWKFRSTYYPYALMMLRRYNCPTSLTAFSGLDAVTIYSAIGGTHIIVDQANTVGRTGSLYASSTGRLLLAALTEEEARAALEEIPLTPFTDRTPGSISDILRSLPEIREKGYARLDGEMYYGYSSFSFPLRDISDRLVGSLNLVIKEEKADDLLSEEEITEIKKTLDKARLYPL